MFTEEEKIKLYAGERVVIVGSIYILCFKCSQVVKVKWLFGTLHVCAGEEKNGD